MMTLLTCSTSRGVGLVCALLCVWACTTQAHTLAQPSSHAVVTSLAEAKQRLVQYRLSGDDHLLDGVAAYFEAQGAPTPQARLLRAWHAQAAHQFSEASAMLAPILGSGRTTAWLLEANLQRVMGNHMASEGACRHVLPTRPLLGQVCLLQTRAHQDQPPDPAQLNALERMYELMYTRQALEVEQRAWIMSVMSDGYLAMGHLPPALAWSKQAFETSATIQNRAAYAARLLDTKQHAAVLTLIDATEQAPALVVLRLRALQQLGRLDEAQKIVSAVDHQFRHDNAHGDLLHAREMAQFYLDILPHPERAKWLVVQNWAAQKEIEDRSLLVRGGGFL